MEIKITNYSLFIMSILIGFNLSSARWTSRDVSPGYTQTGICSWYGDPNDPAEIGLTADGEYFNGASMTAASPMLPYNSTVTVSNENGETVLLRINDNGPCCGRILDISQLAAIKLGVINEGIWKCTVKVISVPQ